MSMEAPFAEAFTDARPVAKHCAELTWRGSDPDERKEHLSAWCRDLGIELAQELGQLLSGGKLRVSVAEPEFISGQDVFERIGPVAANNLLRCGNEDQTILFSLDLPTAIALTDASFGGLGAIPQDVPAQLPRSAGLLIEQIAGSFARVVALASGSTERSFGDVLVRSESASRLKPFSAAAEVAFLRVTMNMGSEAEWSAILAIAGDQMDGLLPGMNSPRPARLNANSANSQTTGPFLAIPILLEAALSEFEVPLGTLDALSPGDEIPLSIPRELPLRMGDEVLARGTIGTVENRMALRITSLQQTPCPGQDERVAA